MLQPSPALGRQGHAIGYIPAGAPDQTEAERTSIPDESDAQRLTFIRRCREFGFGIEQVRSLVLLTETAESDCTEARDIAQAHLATLALMLSVGAIAALSEESRS